MSAFNAKAMVWPRNADFGQIRHGVEWRPAMFRVASVSVKCGRGGGPDLASIGDDDIPYISYKILYLIFDYPHKHYTFKYFEV